MVRSIPVNLLIHSVVYYKRIGKTEYEEILYDSGIELKKVRVEPKHRIIKNTDGDDLQSQSILFYDSVKSVPRDIDFNMNDKITFNNKDYIILAVNDFYDNKKLHHKEIALG